MTEKQLAGLSNSGSLGIRPLGSASSTCRQVGSVYRIVVQVQGKLAAGGC